MESIDLAAVPFPVVTNGTGLLVASWALSITWGIILLQLFSYLQGRKRDHIILQILVVFLFLCETASTIMACVSVHEQLLILKPGSFEAMFQLPHGFIIMNYFNHATLCFVNLFLIWRLQGFTKNWWLTVPLIVLTLGTLCLHWYMDTRGLQSSLGGLDVAGGLEFVQKVMKISKAAAVMEFTVVSVTYILLLIELSSYLRQNLLSGRTIIKRLIFMTLESGTFTVALAAGYVAMVFSKTDPAGLTIIVTCAARAYYMTMLFNLNWRSDGGLVMQEPDLSHITQLRVQPSAHLAETGSSGTGSKQNIIHLSQDMRIEDDEQSQHEKTPYASIDHKHAAAV